MRPTRTAVSSLLLTVTACSGSSSGGAAQTTAPSPQPTASPSPSPLAATPPPPSFATGTYSRTVKLQGDLDGRWQLVLQPDGRYQLVSPQTTFTGTYVVSGSRIAFTDAECGTGSDTFTRTSAGLRFVEVGNDPCDFRHALLAGQAWPSSP